MSDGYPSSQAHSSSLAWHQWIDGLNEFNGCNDCNTSCACRIRIWRQTIHSCLGPYSEEKKQHASSTKASDSELWVLDSLGGRSFICSTHSTREPRGNASTLSKKGQSGPSQIGFSTKDLFNVGLLETSPTGHFRYTCPLQGSDGPGFCPSFGLTKDFYSIYILIPTATRGRIPTASPG